MNGVRMRGRNHIQPPSSGGVSSEAWLIMWTWNLAVSDGRGEQKEMEGLRGRGMTEVGRRVPGGQ